MNITVWHSTEEFAEYIVANTVLSNAKYSPMYKKLYESDANNGKNFHAIPDHIKQILYLDAPDIIVEIDSEPIFSIEISQEAGTGHNAFQRFARLAASVENGVPALYIYPEATIITRTPKGDLAIKWDRINPLIFHALDQVMNIHSIPALLFYFPTDYPRYKDDPTDSPNYKNHNKGTKKDLIFPSCPDSRDSQMQDLFKCIDKIFSEAISKGVIQSRYGLLAIPEIRNRRSFMTSEFHTKAAGRKVGEMSPLTAVKTMSTNCLLNYLKKYEKGGYSIGGLLRSRPETLIYCVDAAFRGDPYPGALAAIDYISARSGKTFEEREFNLVLAWGNLSVDLVKNTLKLKSDKATIVDFVKKIQISEDKNILSKSYSELKPGEVPRYYMQVRYGSMFSKSKDVRVISYFADAILFPDGALWRDG
jgi:hypothetical protein